MSVDGDPEGPLTEAERLQRLSRLNKSVAQKERIYSRFAEALRDLSPERESQLRLTSDWDGDAARRSLAESGELIVRLKAEIEQLRRTFE